MKKLFCNLLWKFAGISPSCGNLVLDILGEEKYRKLMYAPK